MSLYRNTNVMIAMVSIYPFSFTIRIKSCIVVYSPTSFLHALTHSMPTLMGSRDLIELFARKFRCQCYSKVHIDCIDLSLYVPGTEAGFGLRYNGRNPLCF